MTSIRTQSNRSGNRDKDYAPYGFLVVDDEEGIQELVVDALRTLGAKVVQKASNGEHAIGILMADPSRFHIVVSDCNMKPINGLQLLKTIRSGKAGGVSPDLPIILLTGHSDVPVVQRAVELKASGFLAKPVSLDKLTAAINKALSL